MTVPSLRFPSNSLYYSDPDSDFARRYYSYPAFTVYPTVRDLVISFNCC